jgi:hypothetical protein
MKSYSSLYSTPAPKSISKKSTKAKAKSKKNKNDSSEQRNVIQSNGKYYVSEARQTAMAEAQKKVMGLDVKTFDSEDAALEAAIRTNMVSSSH